MTSASIHTASTALVTVEDVAVPGLIRLRDHGHDSAHLCFVYEGALEERMTRRSRVMSGGMLRTSPAGDTHDLSFSSIGARCLVILLDDELSTGGGLPADRRYYDPAAHADLAAAIRRRLAAGSAIGVELLVLELLARLARPERRQTPGHRPPGWLLRVRDALHDCPAAPPSTRELARGTNLHPVYVARVFRRWFGCSITDYARRQRLDFARRRIVESSEPISRLAMEAGFTDQSHLHRAMRRHLGQTPGALRRSQVSSVQDAGVPPR
jgi:AraC family transcriptional regulator